MEIARCGHSAWREEMAWGRTVSCTRRKLYCSRRWPYNRARGWWRRQVVEHRLARLAQLGVRQARYFGRTKTLFQLLMASTVANLTLVAGQVGMMGKTFAKTIPWTAVFAHIIISADYSSAIRMWHRGPLALTASASPPQSLFRTWASRPDF